MKPVGYVRRSVERDNEYGLDAQRDALRRWAGYREVDLVGVLPDDDVSGRAAPGERPGLTEALRLIGTGEADALVFTRLDRLARSVTVFSSIVKRSRDEGWQIVCLDPEFDTGTAAGRLVANVFASVGEWELENTVERLQAGRRAKAEPGGYIGGSTIPIGKSCWTATWLTTPTLGT